MRAGWPLPGDVVELRPPVRRINVPEREILLAGLPRLDAELAVEAGAVPVRRILVNDDRAALNECQRRLEFQLDLAADAEARCARDDNLNLS